MIFRTYRPGPPLDQIVDHMVFYRGYSPEHSRERMLPDSGVYLIIDLTDDPKQVYDNTTLGAIQSCRKSWISGVHYGYITIDAGVDSSMLVVRFRPGGAHLVLGLPITELAGRVLDADLLLGRSIGDLRDALLEGPLPESKFRLMETYLRRRLSAGIALPTAVRYAINELEAAPSEGTVGRLQFETGFSRKHLGELFGRWVGVSPKRFQRIARFQRALAEIELGRGLSWPALAVDCGYYDQAHFINDFRLFCGLTPGRYRDDRGEYLNYIPLR